MKIQSYNLLRVFVEVQHAPMLWIIVQNILEGEETTTNRVFTYRRFIKQDTNQITDYFHQPNSLTLLNCSIQ